MSNVTYTSPTATYVYDTANGQYAGYYVSNDAWGVGNLVDGTDYSCSVTFDPTNFQSGTTFTWTYPANVGGVYAYPHISYDVNTAPVSTAQVGNIASLSVSYSAVLSNPTNSTLAFDLWFNSQPMGPWATTSDEILIEVAPTSPGTPNEPFTITDSTIKNASVYVSSSSGAGATWKFVDIKSPTALMSDTLSLSDIFKTLIWDGVLTGREYLTSVQFGSEVHGGSGSLQVNSLNYNWTAVASLVATGANDTFVITNMGGNDVIGNGGVDTVVYAGSYSNYQIKSSGSEILITEGNNISTLDELQGITFIQFSDGTYNIATGSFTSNAGPLAPPLISSYSLLASGVLTATGTAAANSTVTVFDGTTDLGTAPVNASGNWSFTTGTLSNATHSFTVTDTNAAGNTSAASSALSVTVTGNGDTITFSANNASLGLTDPGDTVILSGSNDGVNLTADGDVVQLSGSNDVITIMGGGNSINVTGSNNSISTKGAGGNSITLGTGTTTISFTSGSNTVNATQPTLLASDSLIGAGSDTLVLTGGGSFNLNSLSTFTGFNEVTLGTNGESLTLKSGQNLAVTTFTEALGNTETVTLASHSGADTVTFSGSGSDTLNATIGTGATLNLLDNLTGSGSDTLALTGSSGTINLTQLAHFSGFSGVSLSGSSDVLTLTNANLTVTRLSGSGDTIKLGTGIDTVVYTNVNQSTYKSADSIIGFNVSNDKIDFSAISGLNSNTQPVHINFLKSTPSSIAAHTIDVVTSGGNTEVYANATGSSELIKHHQEDMQVNLTGVAAPNSSDFIFHH